MEVSVREGGVSVGGIAVLLGATVTSVAGEGVDVEAKGDAV
jgi:hypothetical protein